MRTSLRAIVPCTFLALALAGCDGDDSGNRIFGVFDGDEVGGESVSSTAVLDGDFLDVLVTTTVVVVDEEGKVDEIQIDIQIERWKDVVVGEMLPVSTGGAVSATVVRGSQPQRPCAGGVMLDVLDAKPGGTVAGSFDLAFNGGNLNGYFDARIE